jgi:hypothetical protein
MDNSRMPADDLAGLLVEPVTNRGGLAGSGPSKKKKRGRRVGQI